ncbi:MAG TPA: DUF58 domain-containing protein [Kofleriaceae bacterium]|nr:DUF58 domain-containing protein [Kofleriaceae bacterium]
MSALLSPALLGRIERVELRAQAMRHGALAGLHRARGFGSSIEFAEHKEYAPGDDIRHLDWKVYGKVDRYHVKQFEHESEQTAYVVVDASASMAYAGDGPSKLLRAATLAAAIAHVLIRQRDKAGLYLFGDPALERYVPPRSQPVHLRDLLIVLEDVATAGGRGEEAPSRALDRVAELAARRRSLIVLISDLFEAGGQALSALRRLRARHHDVAVIHTLDDDELSLPFHGQTRFESLEGPRALTADPGAIRKLYSARMAEFLAQVESECRAAAIHYVRAVRTTPPEDTLTELSAARERRRPGRRR